MERHNVYRLCSLVIFLMDLVNGPCASFGDVTLKPLGVETFSTFECQAKSDIHIQFTNASDNITRKIAECESAVQACHLADQSFGNHYAVSYTGFGARFSVKTNDEETRGIYKCCESFKSDITCKTLQIRPTPTNTFKSNSIPENNEQIHDKQAHFPDLKNCQIPLFVMCISTASSVLTVYILHQMFKAVVSWCKRRNTKKNSTQANGSILEAISVIANHPSVDGLDSQPPTIKTDFMKAGDEVIIASKSDVPAVVDMHGLDVEHSERKTDAEKHAEYVNIFSTDQNESDALVMNQTEKVLRKAVEIFYSEIPDGLDAQEEDVWIPKKNQSETKAP